MIKVALHGAEFFAYHGFYPEEQLTGTHFVTDIEVVFQSPASLNDDQISHTVNYETLYNVIGDEMSQPKKLLETVAQNILNRVTKEFTFIETAEVTIKKLRPPFKGIVKHSAVTISYKKDNEL